MTSLPVTEVPEAARPLVGDRVTYFIAQRRLAYGHGVYLRKSGSLRGRPLWDVRRDDGELVTLIAADGDHMVPALGDIVQLWAPHLPNPGKCSCDGPFGCYEHAPQPRERAVPCRQCRKSTWTVDAVCLDCQRTAEASPTQVSSPKGGGDHGNG